MEPLPHDRESLAQRLAAALSEIYSNQIDKLLANRSIQPRVLIDAPARASMSAEMVADHEDWIATLIDLDCDECLKRCALTFQRAVELVEQAIAEKNDEHPLSGHTMQKMKARRWYRAEGDKAKSLWSKLKTLTVSFGSHVNAIIRLKTRHQECEDEKM